MPFEVLTDGATIPKSLGRVADRNGNEYQEHVSYVYAEGDIIADEDVSPTIQQMLEDGDGHVSQMLKKVSDSEAEKTLEQRESDEEQARIDAGASSAVGKVTTAGGDQPPYIDYDQLSAREIVARMGSLSPAQVLRVKAWERGYGRGRSTILDFEPKEGADFLITGEPAPGQPTGGSLAEDPVETEESSSPAPSAGAKKSKPASSNS
jgi:hypothetical protein